MGLLDDMQRSAIEHGLMIGEPADAPAIVDVPLPPPATVSVPAIEPERSEPAEDPKLTVADDTLPTRRRPPPTNATHSEPVAVRFARKVIASGHGEWERYDVPVSRSIVSKKAREFADRHGVEFTVHKDHADPDDPTSPRASYLFCRVVAR